ncbi:MAG: CPBP family intramembrane metalloprotease [Bacteroidales bacterium]|nr:CPBP family intramembrane metalloprotease [Bacteroidales bacterium]
MFKKIVSYTPTVGESWIMFVCVVVCGSLLAAPTTLPFVKDISVISLFLSYILTLSPAFVYAYLKGKKGQYSPKRKINDSYFGKMNPVVLFIMLPVILVAYLFVIDPAAALFTTPEWFRGMVTGNSVLWSSMTVCVCAPLLEELLCRGIMLRGMMEKGVSPAKAIFWSSLIFGVIHMNPWQALPAFLLGLLFGWLYYKTGNIWITIFLHFLNNASSLFIYHVYPDLAAAESIKAMIGNDQIYFPIYAISVAVLALSYFLISKYVGRRDEQETVISA